MFAITLLPPTELGPDGQRLGSITIGNFRERFVCSPVDGPVDKFPERWRSALCELVGGKSCITLVYDPRFAWLVYRDDAVCFVQQKLSLDGSFDLNSPREVVSVDGDRISEWSVSVESISQFLASK
ncbi:MAG: hypothetical protein HQ518_27735 [Rhodopirellula sp.]|nr:hypothetical protein [Rhodopirellula sp.]